jgi:hypothetical protein
VPSRRREDGLADGFIRTPKCEHSAGEGRTSSCAPPSGGSTSSTTVGLIVGGGVSSRSWWGARGCWGAIGICSPRGAKRLAAPARGKDEQGREESRIMPLLSGRL